MSFLDAIKSGFYNYVKFSGRATRAEFWYFWLFCMLTNFALQIVLMVIFGIKVVGWSGIVILSGVMLVYSVATHIPLLALSVRRLHDINRRGWWLLLPLAPMAAIAAIAGVVWMRSGGSHGPVANIPEAVMVSRSGENIMAITGTAATLIQCLFFVTFVTGVLLLVWHCTKGTSGNNRFGVDPLPESSADVDRLGTASYVVAGLGFIPMLGFFFAIAAIIIGLVKLKKGGHQLILLGCLAVALNISLPMALRHVGSQAMESRYDQAFFPAEGKEFPSLYEKCDQETKAFRIEHGFFPNTHNTESCVQLKSYFNLFSKQMEEPIQKCTLGNQPNINCGALADFLENVDKYQEAIMIAQVLCQSHPKGYCNLVLGVDHFRAGNFPKAVELLKASCQEKDAEGCYRLAQAECALSPSNREYAVWNIRLANAYAKEPSDMHTLKQLQMDENLRCLTAEDRVQAVTPLGEAEKSSMAPR